MGMVFAVQYGMNRSLSLLPFLFLAATSLGACSSNSSDSENCQGDRCDINKTDLALCAAIRGNGELITAHFAGLARIVEHYGQIDGAAGGSSASITIFMTDSIQANPAIQDCAGQKCNSDETAARTALLLKSFPGYMQHLGTTEEAATLGNALPVIQRIQEEGIDALLDSDAPAAINSLIAVLETQEFQDLVNPELVLLLQNSPNPEMHARDILAAIEGLASFSLDAGDKVFIRPSLLSFPAIADKLGRVADFYAGYGPADPASMEEFMSSCATPGLGMNWFEVSAIPAGDSTCGAIFDKMVGTYRAALAENPDSFSHRIDDVVGGKMSALISTSVMSGNTATSFTKAREDYVQAQDYSFTPNFDDITFGYWGNESDLRKVAANSNGYDDLKTKKFKNLGTTTWRTALSLSPAEPGLSRAIEMADGQISAGGWSDLHPVLALRNLGCEQVVYLTRAGEESGFAQGIAGLLGMDKTEQDALYNLDVDSAFSLSLAETDATWCTDWDAFAGTELFAITEDAYNAPMMSESSFFTKGEGVYKNINTATLRGCSPGAPVPAQ